MPLLCSWWCSWCIHRSSSRTSPSCSRRRRPSPVWERPRSSASVAQKRHLSASGPWRHLRLEFHFDRHPLGTGHSNRTYPSPKPRIHRLDERWPSPKALEGCCYRADLGMARIPLEGPLQAVAQIDLRFPADPLADLRGVQVLAVDLAARVAGAAVLRLYLVRPELADQVDHLAHRMRPAPA